MPSPGVRIHQYELVRELGAGGMGTVYLARDTKLGRRVAIKFLQSNHPDLTQRFLIEARATARCRHDNIVVIHEVDEHNGQPYMVLEYLDGRSLMQIIGADLKLPYPRAVEIMVPVLRALVVAHEQGIVHRDLKPENILVTDSGAIKVLDFGIAKVAQANVPVANDPSPSVEVQLQDEITSDSADLTRRGTIVGTAKYMSPEQWQGGSEVDHRTDIWAAGILLYRMIAGRHPLSSIEGSPRVTVAHLDRPMPKLRQAAPDVPNELADVVDRCLRKRKDERWPSARELLDALEPFRAPAAAPPRRRWQPWVTAIVVAAAALVLWWSKPEPEAIPVGMLLHATEPAPAIATVPEPSPVRRPPPTGTPYQRGLEHLRRWEGAAARKALDEALAAAPGDVQARLARCQALLMSRDYPHAAAEAKRALAQSAVPAATRRLLEACHRSATADYAGAATLYREAFSQSGDAEIGIALAMSQVLALDATGLESTLEELRALPGAGDLELRLGVLDGHARFLCGDYPGASERWRRAAARAAAEGLPVLQAMALDRGGNTLRILGELQSASAQVEQARRLYLEAGEELRLAEVLHLQTDVLYDLGELRRTISVYEAAIALFKKAGNHQAMFNSMGGLAQMRFLTGDHAAGRRGIEEVAQQATEHGMPRPIDDYTRGWERLHAGDALAARRLTEKSRAGLTANAGPYWIAYFEWNSGEAALLAGDLPAARKALERATAVASGANFRTSAACTRVLLAATALAEGKPAEAEALARHAIGELDHMGVRDCRTRGRAVRARALRALGRAAAAHAVLAEAAAISPPTEDVWIRWDLEVAIAEDEIARGDRAAARARLVRTLDEAGTENADIALAAAVVLGGLEQSEPSIASQGRARLQAAAQRARVLGQLPLELRAQAALHASH